MHGLDGLDDLCVTRQWQGIPGLEATPGGRLFACWFTGGSHEPQPENTVLVTYSDDGGQTFAPPLPMALPRDGARTFDPTLWLDPLGRLWLIFNRGNPTSGLHGVHARRCDVPDAERPVWSNEFRVGFDQVALSFRMNKPTVLGSGEWIMPVTHAVEKTHDWFARERQRQGVGISTDQGRSWTLHGSLEAPCWALENMIVEKQDGRLWMLIRTGGGFLWESYSADRGRSWLPAAPSRIANPGSRFFIRRLASGNLLLVNHYRFTGRSHLTAQISTDDGATWNEGLLLDERVGVSYPDGCQTPDGLIRIVHDRDRKGDGDILMSVFREEDVLAGGNRSGAVRLRVPISTLKSVRVGCEPLVDRPLLGLGVEAEPPPFLFRDKSALDEAVMEGIMARAERRLGLLRPAIARLFCFPEQWNPSLDGQTFDWEQPDYLRLLRLLRRLRELDCQVNLVLFSTFDKPIATIRRAVAAMVALLGRLRRVEGFDHLRWLTLFNEPESAFRQDSELARTIFGARPPLHTWDEYVELNRLAVGLLEKEGMGDIRLALPDSAWGGQMRRERLELTAAAFPTEDICFSYHHYNPEKLDFYATAPAAFQYHGMREEAERFRRLVGPERQLVIWEFNRAGSGFSTHDPGRDAQDRPVLEVPETGAKLAARVLRALRHGVDGLCLWHLHDSDINKFGLWRWADGAFAVKPYWHYYALLCHALRPGQRRLPVAESPAPVDVLATLGTDGSRRILLLNDSDQEREVALALPEAGQASRLRLWPEILPGPEVEAPFAVEEVVASDADGRLQLVLNPWELTCLTVAATPGEAGVDACRNLSKPVDACRQQSAAVDRSR